jgi:hypothetical protein
MRRRRRYRNTVKTAQIVRMHACIDASVGPRTLSEQARDVAQAIDSREREGRPWRWVDFGLETNEPQIARVWTRLQALRRAAGRAA